MFRQDRDVEGPALLRRAGSAGDMPVIRSDVGDADIRRVLAAGKVAEVGDRVDDLVPGDRVFGMSNRFCGGVLAEYALFDRGELEQAPECLSPVESAAVPLAALTALQALRDLGRLEPGQSLLINGASGGVGHFAVQIGRIMGAEVHAVCGSANAGFVTRLGAAQVHDYSAASPDAIDHGFDVVFDVFGDQDPRLLARQLGRDGIFVSTVPRGRTIGRELLARLEPARRVYYTDENGAEVRMDDEQRVQAIAETRDYIARYCD